MQTMNPSRRERYSEVFDAYKAGEPMKSIAKRMGVSPGRISAMYRKEWEMRQLESKVRDTPWDLLMVGSVPDLSTRLNNALLNEFRGKTMGELAEMVASGEMTKAKVVKIPNAGKVCWDELVQWFSKQGTHFPEPTLRQKNNIEGLQRRLEMVRKQIAKWQLAEAEVLRLLGR